MKAGRTASSSASALSSITLQWIRSNMPRTRRVLSNLPPDLKDVRLAASIHFEPKLLVLLEGLRGRGAGVFLVPCNVATAKRSFVDGALGMGCTVGGGLGGDVDDAAGSGTGAEAAAAEALLWRPTHTLEMGADLTAFAHRADASDQDRGGTTIRGAVECTRSGLSRLDGLELRYPVFDADSIPAKNELHNRFMVGLTTWSAFLSCTALSLHEKTVAVVGFGAVGEGLASSAHHFGAAVRVVDVDPARRVAAAFRGWNVSDDLDEAVAASDVIVTATGRSGVLRGRHFDGMRDGTVLINAGHLPDEIDVAGLASKSAGWTDPAPHLREYVVDEAPGGPAPRRICLFAGGSMANLVAGVGDSLNAFDTTLAVITAALGYALDDARSMQRHPGLHAVPRCVWSAAME